MVILCTFFNIKTTKETQLPPKGKQRGWNFAVFCNGKNDKNEDGNLISINNNMPYQAASNELNPLASKSDWDKYDMMKAERIMAFHL